MSCKLLSIKSASSARVPLPLTMALPAVSDFTMNLHGFLYILQLIHISIGKQYLLKLIEAHDDSIVGTTRLNIASSPRRDLSGASNG